MELNWSMGGKKVFGSEPIDGVLAKLFQTSGRKEQYKGRYKKLENAITSGKTIDLITSSGEKFVALPKTSQNHTNTSGRNTSSSNTHKAQTSIMKVIPGQKGAGKNNNKGRGSGNTRVSVSGTNPQGPSENTHSQKKNEENCPPKRLSLVTKMQW